MGMKRTLHFYPVLLLILFVLPIQSLIGQTEDVNRQIESALGSGNTQELEKYFNSMVDLSLPGIEDAYGKTQAIRILGDFFSKNPVKSYKTSKTGNSNDGSQFSIGKMEAGNKSFRIFFLIKKISGQYLIHQFQIQEEK